MWHRLQSIIRICKAYLYLMIRECLEVLFGPDYEVISGLVLTTATDLYEYVPIDKNNVDSAEIPVCSGDMLFNIFNEYMGFYEN